MGALACCDNTMTLANAFARFNLPNSMSIYKLNAQSATDAISKLAGWLKECRAHGRSRQNENEQKSPYFPYAKNDHDIGYNMQGTQNLAAFRPALGLPIIQRIQRGTNQWNERQNTAGRFASPVILRPHKDALGRWHALIIFVDAKKWPKGEQVYLNGRPRTVSLELYEAMKQDPRLQAFP